MPSGAHPEPSEPARLVTDRAKNATDLKARMARITWLMESNLVDPIHLDADRQ